MYAECVAGEGCETPTETGSQIRGSYYDNATYANYPVIFTSWYTRGTTAGGPGAACPLKPSGRRPRGTDGRSFPWGDEFVDGNANWGGVEQDTTSVGAYPAGASPYVAWTCSEMSGSGWRTGTAPNIMRSRRREPDGA